jgi:short-subunit dehydrogenase
LPGAVDTPFWRRKGSVYDRAFPRSMAPEEVARKMMRAVKRRRPEVFMPGWLTIAARVHGAAPVTYARLARCLG